MTANGRRIGPDSELSIFGIRGRCRFIRYVRTETGVEWVDVLTSAGRSRTVRPEAIKRVHRRKAS